jgi:hypothetical protein
MPSRKTAGVTVTWPAASCSVIASRSASSGLASSSGPSSQSAGLGRHLQCSLVRCMLSALPRPGALVVTPAISLSHPQYPCQTLNLLVTPAISLSHPQSPCHTLNLLVTPSISLSHPQSPCHTLNLLVTHSSISADSGLWRATNSCHVCVSETIIKHARARKRPAWSTSTVKHCWEQTHALPGRRSLQDDACNTHRHTPMSARESVASQHAPPRPCSWGAVTGTTHTHTHNTHTTHTSLLARYILYLCGTHRPPSAPLFLSSSNSSLEVSSVSPITTHRTVSCLHAHMHTSGTQACSH